jgi:hypothetical protein
MALSTTNDKPPAKAIVGAGRRLAATGGQPCRRGARATAVPADPAATSMFADAR